jgi:hypothetical protein
MDGSFGTHKIFGRFHLLASRDPPPNNPEFRYFTVDGVLVYLNFFDDFGPMSLSHLYFFSSLVEENMKQYPDRSIALYTSSDRRKLTNAIFLVGSYMIIQQNMSPEEIMTSFEPYHSLLVPYRDVSPGTSKFDLHVTDCWRGLWRARSLGWVDFSDGDDAFDPLEYEHHASPLNGSLHELVPDKFIGFRGPRDLPVGQPWRDVVARDGRFLYRDFSPAHYLPVMRQLGVQVTEKSID